MPEVISPYQLSLRTTALSKRCSHTHKATSLLSKIPSFFLPNHACSFCHVNLERALPFAEKQKKKDNAQFIVLPLPSYPCNAQSLRESRANSRLQEATAILARFAVYVRE